MVYLGVDIGGTAVKMGIVTEKGEILSKRSYDVAFDDYETPIFETVKRSIDIFLRNSNISPKELSGIGVSATGQIDSKRGIVIGVGGNIKNWCGTEIKKELELIYGIHTTVINDANCMVIGEQWLGGAKGYKNVIGITIGTGVGGGIIVESNILLGSIGIAGEIGHFSIKSNGMRCQCGNVGCYEKYASMTALVKEVKENYQKLGDVPFKKQEVNGMSIFSQLEANKELQYIVSGWIQNISNGLISLVHIFNPDIILIGGGVSTQEKLFIEPIRRVVLSKVMDKFKEGLKIEAAILGNDAGIIGAVYYNIKSTK